MEIGTGTVRPLSGSQEASVSQHSTTPETLSIDRQEQIEELCDECRRNGQFAFDTEFVMEDSFEPELCLIQVATSDSVAIIDPYLDLDVSPVWQLVCDPTVETIVHSGQEDLALCVQHAGKVPRTVYDTQIGAGFTGLGYPLSLQKLVQATLHIRLHKSKTLTDWRRRPLTRDQIRYAAEDVCHLPAIRKKFEGRLAASGRRDWMREECARFEDLSLYRRADEEKLTRIKGAGALHGRQLVVLRELLTWRESAAKQLDRPVRVVLKDHLLVEVAKHEICSPDEVRDLRGLNLSDKRVRELCRVVRTAMETPSAEWPKPQPRETETAAESVLVPLLTGVLRGFCHEHDLAYGLVASKKSIQDLIRCNRGSPPKARSSVDLLKGWRGHTVGALLDELMAGQTTIRIGSLNGEALLDLMHTGAEKAGDRISEK